MNKLASLARVAMLAGLLLAALGSTGCRMYPAGYGCGCDGCMSCGGGCASCGHGPDCGCGRGLAGGKKKHGHELAEEGPPAMPAPHARFHPVPTRPVFASRGPTLATREVEVEVEVEEDFDFRRDSTTSVIQSPDRTAQAGPSPRLARRPTESEPVLEPASGQPTPAVQTGESTSPAEPRTLPHLEQGASLQPVRSGQPRRAVASQLATPQPAEPDTESQVLAQPATALDAEPMIHDAVWRARLMSR